MLMQLKLAGKLEQARGIIFGEMIGCAQNPEQLQKLHEGIRRLVADLGIPVAFGVRSGHVSRANVTLPFGVRARLKVDREVELTVLESACVARDMAISAEKRT